MPSKDEIKRAYEEAKRNQADYSRNPNSPAAKKTARTGGAIMFLVGALLAGANYYLWVYQQRFIVLLLAAAAAFLGLGLYFIVFGKAPARKR